jgi:hypothetical protein
MMRARRSNDVAAVRSKIDAAADYTGAVAQPGGVPEQDMFAAASSERSGCMRQRPVLRFKLSEGFITTMIWIDINGVEAGYFAGSKADVGVGPSRPPPLDGYRIGCCVLETTRTTGMLAGPSAVLLPAGAPPLEDAVDGNDGNAQAGIFGRSGTEIWLYLGRS